MTSDGEWSDDARAEWLLSCAKNLQRKIERQQETLRRVVLEARRLNRACGLQYRACEHYTANAAACAAGPYRLASEEPPNGALCIIDDYTWAGDERWFIGRWKQGAAEHGGYWVTDDGLYSANKDTKRWAEIRGQETKGDD